MKTIEKINELLNGFFNPDGNNYKQFVGDPTREYLTEIDIVGSLVNYSSGDFNSINDNFNTLCNFLPCQSENTSVQIKVGDYVWLSSDNTGSNKIFIGQGVGTLAGAVEIIPDGNWTVFSREINGIKTIHFPPLGIGSMSIGSTFKVGYYSGAGVNENNVSFFFSKSAFIFAFLSNNSKIIITVDGSVYKGSVSNENLVINGTGQIGLAGGGNITAKVGFENTGVISNIIGYLKRMGEFLGSQLSIKTAVGTYLDYIGSTFFGIERIIGEVDIFYSERIKNQTFSLKETPINIEKLVKPFCTDVYIDDDYASGAFADATFADFDGEYQITDPSPEWVFSCRAGSNYGLIFFFTVYILQPLADYELAINDIISRSKVAGTIYDLFAFDTQEEYDKAIGA